MFHKRHWSMVPAGSAESLAEKLTQRTWTLCTGWTLDGYAYLNDSLSEDGAGEWAIVDLATMRQIESVTFGWMNQDRALDFINQISAGQIEDFGFGPVDSRELQHPKGYCNLCR